MRFLLACLLLVAYGLLAAGEAPRPAFFNQRVSSRTIALNQPVRLEFTTIPRQIESVNIEASVADAITVGQARRWRLVGRPGVQIDDKTRTVRVSLALQPRQAGQQELPTIPVSWLTGEQVVEFGAVTVEPHIVVGGEPRPLPGELNGVAGYAWGSRLSDLAAELGPTTAEGERVLARPQPGLALVFRRGELSEAQIDTREVTLEAARASFLARWGNPLADDAHGLVWVIGWTRIAATPLPNQGGVRVTVLREDLLDREVQARLGEQVFRWLDSPPAGQAPANP